MNRFILPAAVAAGLTFGFAPSCAQASWLSQALHGIIGDNYPGYYGGYFGPGYGAYSPSIYGPVYGDYGSGSYAPGYYPPSRAWNYPSPYRGYSSGYHPHGYWPSRRGHPSHHGHRHR